MDGETKLTENPEVLREKSVPVPLCPPRTAHGQARIEPAPPTQGTADQPPQPRHNQYPPSRNANSCTGHLLSKIPIRTHHTGKRNKCSSSVVEKKAPTEILMSTFV
jgi:hypothetical protein